MGVCDAVAHLANRLSPHVDEKLQAALGVLATITEWKAERSLDQWETLGAEALDKAGPEGWEKLSSAELRNKYPLYALAEEIYELGRFNLYGAYQAEPTEKEYQRLLKLFQEQTIPGEQQMNLKCW